MHTHVLLRLAKTIKIGRMAITASIAYQGLAKLHSELLKDPLLYLAVALSPITSSYLLNVFSAEYPVAIGGD